MSPEQFSRDHTWRRLSEALDEAYRRVDAASAAAITHKYQNGTQQALTEAEKALHLAEQAKLDHEQAISHKDYGSW